MSSFIYSVCWVNILHYYYGRWYFCSNKFTGPGDEKSISQVCTYQLTERCTYCSIVRAPMNGILEKMNVSKNVPAVFQKRDYLRPVLYECGWRQTREFSGCSDVFFPLFSLTRLPAFLNISMKAEAHLHTMTGVLHLPGPGVPVASYGSAVTPLFFFLTRPWAIWDPWIWSIKHLQTPRSCVFWCHKLCLMLSSYDFCEMVQLLFWLNDPVSSCRRNLHIIYLFTAEFTAVT